MARMQSVQSQCCCCSLSVFSALFGIIMLATGVSLVLNYRIMEVDTTGLPPQWQNEEGKKVVGIILICCGLGGMILSALVSALYFTVCSKNKKPASVTPTGQAAVNSVNRPHHQTSSSDPYSTQVNNKHPSQSKTNSSRHGKRSKKKRVPPHLKSYKTRLAPHQEVINENETRQEQFDLTESSHSLDSSLTGSSKTNSTSDDRRGGTAEDIIETSLHNSPPSLLLNINHLPKLSTQQPMLKPIPLPPVTASSVQEEQQVIKTIPVSPFMASSLQGEQPVLKVMPPPRIPASSLQGEQPVLKVMPPPRIPASSLQGEQPVLKVMPPPPIPASSVQEDPEEDEEEEVSQIEEIKKLDKDVANLLV